MKHPDYSYNLPIVHTRPLFISKPEMDCFSQPSKPNTRIPPILMARQTQALEQTTTKANVAAQDQFSRLAALSKQRLYREGATGDPDLRRCIGHHQLLCRTIMEAKDHMKRYLEDVLESESDSDSDSEDEDEILYEKGPVYTEYPQTDEDEGVEGLLFPPKKQPQQPPQQLQQPPTGTTTTTTTTTITSNNDSSPSPRVKQKIFGVVKGLVRRRSTPRNASPSFTAPALEEKTTPLVHIAEKNFSCSQLPVRIHIHEDVVRDGIKSLKRSHSQDTLSTKSASFGMRGRQYAQRLGIKVPAAVSVAT